MLHGSATAARLDLATDVVWLRTAVCGIDSRSLWLQRAERDLLLLRFGQPWLDAYCLHAEQTLSTWLLTTPYAGPLH